MNTIEFEQWWAGPFRFYASLEHEWIADGVPGDEYIGLYATDDEHPSTLIGKYRLDSTLPHLKERSAEWLLAKLDEWRVEAEKLLPDERPNNFLEQSRRAGGLGKLADFVGGLMDGTGALHDSVCVILGGKGAELVYYGPAATPTERARMVLGLLYPEQLDHLLNAAGIVPLPDHAGKVEQCLIALGSIR